jgi:AcrR family transcriptional regulator
VTGTRARTSSHRSRGGGLPPLRLPPRGRRGHHAREAGTGKGSFYLHFDSKEAAYLAVVEASLERFLEKASAALSKGGSVPARLRALVAVPAEHYGHDELLRASLFGGGHLVAGDVSRRAADIQRSRIRRLLAATLEAGKREGTIRSSVDTAATAAVLFEVGWAIVRAELEGTSDVPLEAALATLNEVVGLGLLTRPERGRPTPQRRRGRRSGSDRRREAE